jgi:hypothetical protein
MKCGLNTNFRNRLINMMKKYGCSSTREVNFVDCVFEKTMLCDNIVHHVRHNNQVTNHTTFP